MIGLSLPAGDLQVLCLGAHPDDVEIGCGATLLSLAATRTITATVLLLTGSPERAAEAREAAPAFLRGSSVDVEITGLPDGRLPAHWDAVKDSMESLSRRISPDLIFCPRPDDAHQDHRLVSQLVPTVWRNSLVLQYEIPKWDGDLGETTHYVPVSEADAELKVQLLSKCYPSQQGRDWWTDDLFLGLMRLRGMQCRTRYAEAFTTPKVMLDLAGTALPPAGSR